MDKGEFGSGFLYAEDLLVGGKFLTVDLEIEKAIPPGTIQAANKKMVDKWTITFKGKTKMLVLCSTNEKIIHFITGEQAGEKWVGKTIRISPRIIRFGGDDIVALRVMPKEGTKIRKSLIERLGRPAEWKGN
jgi:hypothetical protein